MKYEQKVYFAKRTQGRTVVSKMAENIGGPHQGEEVVLLTRSVLIFVRSNLLNKCQLTFNVLLDHFKTVAL